MISRPEVPATCAVCGNTFPHDMVLLGKKVRPEVAAEISNAHAHWSADQYICQTDLALFRKKYVHALLESEKGALSNLKQEVRNSLEEHEILALLPEDEHEQNWTFGERLADRVTSFGG